MELSGSSDSSQSMQQAQSPQSSKSDIWPDEDWPDDEDGHPVINGYTHPLHEACRNSDFGTIQALIKSGYTVNQPDSDGVTPLQYSAEMGFIDVVEFLVKTYSADVNTRDERGNTPLHQAAVYGEPEVAEFLIKHGAEKHPVNHEGKKPVDYAAEEMVHLFQ